jgi:hypothetical protein
MVLDENPRNGSMEDVKVVAGGDDGGKASLSAGGLVPSDAAAERLPNKRRIVRLCGIEWTVYPKRIPQTCARSQESVDWEKERRISIDSEILFPSPRFLKKNEMSANNRKCKARPSCCCYSRWSDVAPWVIYIRCRICRCRMTIQQCAIRQVGDRSLDFAAVESIA